MKKLFLTQFISGLFMLFLTTSNVSAQLPFFDGFESGNLTTGGWNSNGNAQVSNISPASGSYCLIGSTTWGINKSFSNLTTNYLYVEFKNKTSQTNTTSLIFRIMDSLLPVHTSAGIIFDDSGVIQGINGSGTGSAVTLMAYDTSKWYSFKLVLDMINKKYDVYIDNVLKANDFDFYSPAFTNAYLFTWSSLAVTGINWMDDMHIYASEFPLEINDLFYKKEIVWYPNPANDKILIHSLVPITSVKIYSLLAQVVKEIRINDQYDLGLSTTDIPDGIYMMVLNNSFTQKLFITHH